MSEPTPNTGSTGAQPAELREASGVSPRRAHDPQTVINPEHRPGPPVAGDMTGGTKSILVRLLFPPEGNDAPASASDAQCGARLGHFEIIDRIRSGGMGAVFRARDTRLDRIVALKVLPPMLSRDPSIVQRFANEAQAAARLDHDSIARVYFVGEEQGLHYIAFEFVAGINLRDLISAQGRLPAADTVNYGLQIASALVHTAAQGVIHRDIKPSNIIVTPQGRAKLVDLGLARQERQSDAAADLTLAGTTLGTFDYISPEQARDPRTADIRSDIYSLGCTLYHMLTGEPPYPEGTVLQKLLQHQGDEAPDPSARSPDVPQVLALAIRRMMAKDPRRRYQSPEELVRDLSHSAEALGLHSVSPEGMVWLPAREGQAPFWERHLAWLVTAATLLLIVGYLEFRRADGPAVVAHRVPDANSSDAASVDLDAASPRRSTAARRARHGSDGFGQAVDPAYESASLSSDRPISDSDGDAGAEQTDEAAPTIGSYVVRGLPQGLPASFRPGPTPQNVAGVPAGRFDSRELPTSPGAVVVPDSESPADDDRLLDLPVAGGRKRSDGLVPDDHSSLLGATFPEPDTDIVLLGPDNVPAQRFQSLEAACSAVQHDGAIIELQFDGRCVETRLRINRQVTIRAALGRRPTIDLRPDRTASDPDQIRAISIPSGALYLVGVDLVLTVDDAYSAEQWAVFSLERPDYVRLQDATVTLVNPKGRKAAIVELRPGPAAMMPDMPVQGMAVRPPLEVEISNSLIRGPADLFLVRHADPARLAVRQSVVALQGALLSCRGGAEISQENAQLELRLDHVTAAVTDGLLKLDSGPLPRKLVPVQVSASDSIFSNAGSAGTPLVWMMGNAPLQDFQNLLLWIGRNNVYDRFQNFWYIHSIDSVRPDVRDFATWKRTETSERNPRLVDWIIWNSRRWTGKPFSDVLAVDFALDPRAPDNPAVGGATDSTDVGAKLLDIPRPASGASFGSYSDRAHD